MTWAERARKALGMSQVEFGRLLGVSQGTISNAETGRTASAIPRSARHYVTAVIVARDANRLLEEGEALGRCPVGTGLPEPDAPTLQSHLMTCSRCLATVVDEWERLP